MADGDRGLFTFNFGNSNKVEGSASESTTPQCDWSQLVLEGLCDFLHVLSLDGRLLYASPSCKAIAGYEPAELVGRLVTDFIHPDDSGVFSSEIRASIASDRPTRFFYRFRNANGQWIIFECQGHPYPSIKPGDISLLQRETSHREFLIMARPYPTPTSALFDRFLEVKIENLRLVEQVTRLRRELQISQETHERDVQGQSFPIPSPPQHAAEHDSVPTAHHDMQPLAPPLSMLDLEPTESVFDKAFAAYNAKQLDSKEEDGLSDLTSKESEGSVAVKVGDLGIPVPSRRNSRPHASERRRIRPQIETWRLCTSCGTVESPEWRRGPMGLNTLCNACGCKSFP